VPSVAVRILHREPAAGAGPLERALAAMRLAAGDRVRAAVDALGADTRVVASATDARSFGERLRELAITMPGDSGLVVLGSGSVAAARPGDLAPFVGTAARGARVALANNRYSADIVAVACSGILRDVPDLTSDNALPRWLDEAAGYQVDDLRGRWRLQVDIDTPIDGLLLGLDVPDGGRVTEAVARVRALAGEPLAELLVAGRTSAASLRWLERSTRARVRAFVEERGLRTSRPEQRPPASLLGAVLERDGPRSLGAHVGRLADAALIDSRVLLAPRLGADEAAWPSPEDRYASDLLLPERITDPWLRELTIAAREALIPIVLGGHTLVGPGIRLAVGARRR
jgi:hypothetical protein